MMSVIFVERLGDKLDVYLCGIRVGGITKNSRDLYQFTTEDGHKGCPYDSLPDLKDDLLHELR